MLSEPKLVTKVLILIKYNLRYTLNFSVTLWKNPASTDIYLRGCFTLIFTDIVLYNYYCCCYCYLTLFLKQFLTSQNIRKNRNIKGALSGLRQCLPSEIPLKMMKNTFCFTWNALFVLKIFKLLPCFFGHLSKWLD